MSEPPSILYSLADGVGTISFNRPHRHNALDTAASELFESLMDKAREDPEVRVILLRGEGPSFCSGRDLAALGKRPPGVSDFAHLSKSLRRKFATMDIQKPIIAAVHGHAIGGGFETALACDIRVVAEDAKLSLPEIKWGIMTDSGGSVVTTALAGPGRAKYLLMTGDVISGREAHEWGLADFVTTADKVHEKALEIALKIAAQPPMHVAVAKQLVNSIYGEMVRYGLRQEMTALTMLYRTEDYQEARAAAREKRKPTYKGI